MKRKTLHGAVALLALLVLSEPALAHSPIAGLSSFYNGILHPILVPAHLLLLIASGLLFGQHGIINNQKAIAAFAGAAIGGLLIAWFAGDLGFELAIVVAALLVSLLVAANLHLNHSMIAGVLALAGFMIGIDSAQEMLAGKERFGALLGSAIGIYLMFLFVMGWSDNKHDRQWQKIGVRIAGSWIAASAMLVLAFTLSAK